MSLIEELRTVIAADSSSTESSLAETSQAQWEAGAKMIQVGAAGGITRLIQAKLDKLQNEFKSAEQRMAHFKKIGVGETESPALLLGPLREMQDLVKFVQRLIKQAVDQTGADLNEGLDGDTLVLDEGAPRSRAEFAKQVTSMASELAKAGSTVDRMRSGLDDMKTSVGFLPPTIAGKTATYTRQGMIKQLETLDASLERASGELESATNVIGGVRGALSGVAEESAGTEYRDGLEEAVWWDQAKYRDGATGERSPAHQEIAAVQDLIKELLKGSPNGHVIELEAFYKTLPAAVRKSVKKYLPSLKSVGGLSLLWPKDQDGNYDKTRLIVAHNASGRVREDIGVFPTGLTVVEEIEALFEKKDDEEEEEDDEEDESEDESEDEEEEDDADDMEEGTPPSFEKALETILAAYKKGGKPAAGQAYDDEVERLKLKNWEAMALAERFRAMIKAQSEGLDEGATPGARSKGTGYGKSETSKAGEFWGGKHDKQDATPERKKEFNKAQRAGKKKHIDAQMKGEETLSAELAALLNES